VCRHLAHLGPPRTLSALLLEPPHGLLHQSYAPADMRGGGTVNADGFGAGWYPPVDPAGNGHAPEPARYRSDQPIWSDGAFASLAAATRSPAVLAAVRSATTGMPVVSTAAAPFTEGPWLFSHNGVVRGWPGSVADLAAGLPVVDLLTLDAPTDAALLWALVRHRLRAGEEPARVLSGVVLAVEAAAPHSRLNLLLTDGSTIWGTAWDHALSVRVTDEAATVASEPLDADPGWTPVPDRHLVVAAPGRLERRAIGPATTPAVTPAVIPGHHPTDTGIPDHGTRAPHP
jgi:glutamine amidotransferase